MALELGAAPIEMAGEVNVIIGKARLAKTAEDLHEAMAGAGPYRRVGYELCALLS